MHPILFELGPVTVYTYGFCIAWGAVLGVWYMASQGKKQFGLTFDNSNSLFLLLVGGGVIGGKLFIIFEDPAYYFSHPSALFSSNGFVFYGSLLTCIPIMLFFFRRHHIPVWAMLDIMAVVTCILHAWGRIGCFMAGCCYGLPTNGPLGVIFTDPACQADPLNTPLHPTQLYEAVLIMFILVALLLLKPRRRFEGQLFLVYLISYATGRAVIEIFRGDLERGFIIQNYFSFSQFVSAIIVLVALYFYVKKRKVNLLS